MMFKYKALKQGKILTKSIEANNQNEVIEFLKKNDYFVIEVTKVETQSISYFDTLFNRISFNDVVDLTRQLAIMLNAGLTLIDAFDILKKQVSKTSLLAIIEDIDKEIRGGKPFSFALKKYPQYFPNLYIALVKSGEASGKLSDILLKLSENLEKQREFHGKIKGALIYPIIVIIGMFIVMFIMVTFVMPKLLSLYKDFDVDLPATTLILMSLSSFMSNFWPLIIIGIVGAIIGGKAYLGTKKGKMTFDQLVLKLPLISNVISMSALVDATRTLSILIASGVSILDGLNIIIDTNDNVVYQNAFTNIYHQVEKGTSLGSSMTNEGIFPPILVQMTTVGEQTGHLDETLMRIARYFESESEMAVKAMTTLIEPAILVFLGLGVGFLVMSVITPIYNLTSSF